MSRPIELLAPARDLACGKTAIACGADAVYIGAPRFGARVAAGNSLEDIAALVAHAHLYWARVYVTLNTLLRDDEIEEAVALAWRLYEVGVDGLIIQDAGLLECDLPPVSLIASTQMHNHTPERVAFLEAAGFQRAILARELDLDQIRAIRESAPEIELECFVHGALCVSYSGQCYASYALGGRSGNRGQCAQPCRKRYDLVDAAGNRLAGGHLLSIRDLNLSDSLGELLDAGISSFKIEGRLKDERYVANVVAHYSQRLNGLGVQRSSSGRSTTGFQPDMAKTFNRGFTSYFLHGRREPIGSPATPKMTGESVGRVVKVSGSRVEFHPTNPKAGVSGTPLESDPALHAGDGLCFFDRQGELRGTLVNAADGRRFVPEKPDGIEPGVLLYRNHDHRFMTALDRARKERHIGVLFRVGPEELQVRDEDGNRAAVHLPPLSPAQKPEAALATLHRQLEKTGDTEFSCGGIELEVGFVPFLPVAAINRLRRDALEKLRQVRARNRPNPKPRVAGASAAYPENELSYSGNVLNRRAETFYRKHGVVRIEPAAESGLDLRGRQIMTTRYCLKYELGMCPKEPQRVPQHAADPLTLVDEAGNRLQLHFDCARCEMQVTLNPPQHLSS
jgi:putative protease